MTGWNLPPGCNESDIPGNRPEDIALDRFYENDCLSEAEDTVECDICQYGPLPCRHPKHPDNIKETDKYDTDEGV
jgi:hypothetical protein